MKASSRFLLIFGIIIVAIVAAAVTLAIAGGNEQVKLLSETSPEGTVQRFLMAVKAQDYSTAYGYLSLPTDEPKSNSYDNWIRSAQSSRNSSSWKASIIKSTVRDKDATVDVAIEVFRPEGPLANPVSTNQVTFILSNDGGKWLINSPADLYWLY
jgi:hypothetical protein